MAEKSEPFQCGTEMRPGYSFMDHIHHIAMATTYRDKNCAQLKDVRGLSVYVNGDVPPTNGSDWTAYTFGYTSIWN